MNPSIDQLEQMVQDLEARYSRERILRELRNLGRALHHASDEFRLRQDALEAARRERQELLDATDSDLARLAVLRTRIDVLTRKGAPSAALVESHDRARDEILARRAAADAAVAACEDAVAGARDAVESAAVAYRTARAEATRQLSSEETASTDAIAAAAPSVNGFAAVVTTQDVATLDDEVHAWEPRYGALAKDEQYALMKLWIGTVRLYQMRAVDDEPQRRLRRLFGELVGLSRQYEPGYIEAFRQDFTADWERWIADARSAATRAAHARERSEGAEMRRARLETRERRQSEEREKLFALLSSDAATPDAIRQLVAGFGREAVNNEDVLEALLPRAALFEEGSEFRSLRRNLARLMRSERPVDGEPAVLAMTRGRRAVIAGGEPREHARAALGRAFEFSTLEWLESGDAPAARAEERIRGGSVDLVILLRSFVGHSVADRLFGAGKESGVPVVLVESGYGVTRVAAALRERIPSQSSEEAAPLGAPRQ